MAKKDDLKLVNDLMEEYGLSPDESDCNPGEEITYHEVSRNGNLILYEYEDMTGESIVSKDIVNELFPEYEVELNKGYLIEKDGKFYL